MYKTNRKKSGNHSLSIEQDLKMWKLEFINKI
jgi:hypothetical protein